MKTSSTAGAARGRSARWLGLAALFVLACASDSTDPGPGPVEIIFAYTPLSQNVSAVVGRPLSFTAAVTGAAAFEAAWALDDEPVGTGPQYTHVAQSVGAHVLAVAVEADGASGGRTWNLQVLPDESRLPPTVAGLAADHGQEPGAVRLSWQKDSTGFYDLADYVVAVSYDGPLDEDTFDAAADTAVVPVQPTLGQQVVLSAPAYDIRPGERAWFAVRARDVTGQRSDVGESRALDVSTAWYLDVAVIDDTGAPRPAVAFSYDCVDCDVGGSIQTDGTGERRLGPFRSVDRFVVRTNSDDTPGAGWYDFTTPAWGSADGVLRITLVTRYPVDLFPCAEGGPPPDFMDYLRKMTRTGTVNPAQEDTLLLRFEDYPVSVFATAGTIEGTAVPLAEHAMAALAPWNEAVGEEILVAAPDSAGADVVVVFDLLAANLAGVTRMADGTPMGASIPRQRLVYVTTRASTYGAPPYETSRCTAIAMHELGHALGLLEHSCLTGEGNLMDRSGNPLGLEGLDPSQWSSIIGNAEAHALRAVRYLPQAVHPLSYE